MIKWWLDYLRLAAWFPALATAGVAFSGAAALLEGVGLAALIPALDASLEAKPHVGGVLLNWLPAAGPARVAAALSAFVVLAILASMSRFLAELALLRVRTSIEYRARETMSRALMNMAWPNFLALRLGDISKAQVMEGLQMGSGTHLFLQGLGALLAAAAYALIAFAMSAQMTLYTLAFGALGAGLYAVVGRWARRHADALSGIVSSIGERVSDIFFGLKFIRATGLVAEATRQASTLYDAWRRSYFMSQLYALGSRHVFEMMGLLFIASFLGIVLSRGTDGAATALVFLAVFYRLAPRLLTVQDSLFQARTCHSWFVTWQARRELAESRPDATTGVHCAVLRRQIAFDGVSLLYPGMETPALTDVTLTIPAGQAVAVVGPSGSGKSTLIDLATGLLAPTSGAVTVDDVPLATSNLADWRRSIGLVMQDTPIIHATVLDNIVWGEATVDVDRAKEAAAMANALEFIERLPQGFDTVVGERGGRLSGGQRQRIALARALYRRPTLLLLDEPTSALDSESEAAVQVALERIKGRCTMLLVAHRLKTVRFADRLVVLEAGQVVEDGDWEALSCRPEGTLARLIRAQQLD